MSARSIAHSAAARLAQFTAVASRLPWAVLWIPIPTAWQVSAQSVAANRAAWTALALLLSIPEVIGLVCILALLVWSIWSAGKTVARRRANQPPQPWVYPWYARIGWWFGAGFLLTSVIVH